MKKLMSIFCMAALLSSAAYVNAGAEDSLPLPDVNTEFKTYMDYRKITDTASVQYDLQQKAYTDSLGIRRIGKDVCVALGTAYAAAPGERFQITLETGNTFTAVAGDIKADIHTDESNSYVELWNGYGDIIEFIVDTDKLDSGVKRMGSIGEYEKYSGNVTSIKKLTD